MGYYTAKLLGQVGRDERFIITVDTTKAGSASDTFVLPTTGSGYNCSIDWGDNNITTHSGTPGNISHIYASSGTYQIKISGTFPRIYFNSSGDKLKLIYIDNWGTGKWASMLNAFYGCSNMSGRYTDNPDTSLVTNMTQMFLGCSQFNQSVSNFNTSLVTNMTYMFYGCSQFNQSVSNFNTSLVTNMSYMFYGCSQFNQSVSNFNTSLVTNMSQMFFGCSQFNQSVSNFNTSLVTNMYLMFQGCSQFKQSLSSFTITAVTNIINMLQNTNTNNTGTTANYDNTLISWAAQSVKPNLNFHGGTAKYSDAGLAARNILTSAPNNWTITDGGHI